MTDSIEKSTLQQLKSLVFHPKSTLQQLIKAIRQNEQLKQEVEKWTSFAEENNSRLHAKLNEYEQQIAAIATQNTVLQEQNAELKERNSELMDAVQRQQQQQQQEAWSPEPTW